MLFDIRAGTLSSPQLAQRAGSGSPSYDAVVAAAGDFDGDAVVEVMTANSRGITLASLPDDSQTQELASSQSAAPAQSAFLHASAADVDGDGRLDGLMSGGGQLRAMNMSLSTVDYYPAPYPVRYALSADLQTQGGHAVFGVGDDQVWQFTTGAVHADGFPIAIPHMADVALFPSQNERLALAAVSPGGAVFLFETGSAVTEQQLIWRSRDGSERSDFAVLRSFAGSSTVEDFFPEHRCYNWPNPARGDVTYIRVYVAEDADITVDIYDLGGDKVDAITASAVGGTDTDIPWNVADVQSDVYLARVSATAGGQSAEKILKIAIVK